MDLTAKIIEMIQSLPEEKKLEVLKFIEHISQKEEEKELKQWNKFSLNSAMRGLEEEETVYTVEDLKEKLASWILE